MFDFAKVSATYTGGGIYTFAGYATINGKRRFFVAGDWDYNEVYFLDTDSEYINNDQEAIFWEDYLNEHTKLLLNGKEAFFFNQAMYRYIVRTEPRGRWCNYDSAEIEARICRTSEDFIETYNSVNDIGDPEYTIEEARAALKKYKARRL